MMSKVVKRESKATVFGIYSLCGTVGILVITKLGGYLFDKYSEKWPFIMVVISFICLLVVIVIFAIIKRLKI